MGTLHSGGFLLPSGSDVIEDSDCSLDYDDMTSFVAGPLHGRKKKAGRSYRWILWNRNSYRSVDLSRYLSIVE